MIDVGNARSGTFVSARRAFRALALGAAVLLVAPAAARAADPPPLLPIAGYLADTAGNAISGTHSLRFSLFTTETAGTPVFVETDGVVAVSAGNFIVYLGAGEPLPLALFRDSAQLWLEVVVDGTEVIQPRMRIATAPYAGSAQYCGDATTLGGSPPAAFAQAAHTHAFASLTGVPAGLADGDNDLLASLTCAAGQVPKVGAAGGGAWACAADADTDTLATLACAPGQMVQRGGGGAWACATLAAVAASGSYADLSGVPAGLVTATRGTAGYLPRFSNESTLVTSNVVQDDAGNVGIGVGRPGAALHVNGTIRWGANLLSPAGVIELGDSASTATAPSIDFHYGVAASQDYNTRIANVADGELRLIANTLRMTPATASAANVILGSSGNAVAAGVVGAVIFGGGSDQFGYTGDNVAASDFGTIGGGINNRVGTNGQLFRTGATVAGGQNNTAAGNSSTVAGGANNNAAEDTATVCGGGSNTAGAASATVCGGSNNNASNNGATIAGGEGNGVTGYDATIGGGSSNHVGGGTSTVGGGIFNTVNGDSAVIAGGASNNAGGTYAAICGGGNNVAGGTYSSVGGGNSNNAAGTGAMVPGGWLNSAAGNYSFAGGYRAKATQNGCFAWGDSQAFDITCATANAWVARATGGVSFVTGINAGSGATTAGVSVAAGSGSWTSLSDRNAKRDITPVEPRAVLAALERVPVSTWSYRAEESGARHMGPMAQDFKAAFGLGDSDRHITTVDADGVALAAVAGLNGISKEHDARLRQLTRENAELRARLERLESRLPAGAPVRPRHARP